MSIKKTKQQLEKHLENIRKESEKIRQMQEFRRKLELRIKAAQKSEDQKQALRLGTDLIRILRENAPGFFDGDGQFDAPLLVGALLDAHAKLSKDNVASKWIEAGEKFIPKVEQVKVQEPAVNEEPEKSVAEPEVVVQADAPVSDLPPIEDMFGSETK